MSKEYFKCGNRKLCEALLGRVKVPGSGGYGLFAKYVILENDLLEPQVITHLVGVSYKTGVKDKGVMLNFCPFCGEKIDWFREETNG
jgi:hypothetical protein